MTLRVPGAAQRETVRCRTGTVTYSVFGKAPDQRRTTSLTLVLRRIRGTPAAYSRRVSNQRLRYKAAKAFSSSVACWKALSYSLPIQT